MTPGQALYRALVDASPFPSTLRGMARVFSRENRVAVPALAIAMSGTTVKTSREYRNAKRSIERWLNYEAGSGRQARRPPGPSDPRMERIRQATQARAVERTLARIRRGGCSAFIEGTDDYDGRTRRYPAFGLQYVSPAALRAPEAGSFFRLAGDAADAGRAVAFTGALADWETAADAFQEAFFTEYGIGAHFRVDDVDDQRLEVG